MQSLFLMVIFAVLFLAAAVAIFFWAVGSGQYDDLDREADRILFDDDQQHDPENGG